MKLVSYRSPRGAAWGVQVPGGVVPSERLGADVPDSLRALVADSALWSRLVQELPARAAAASPLAVATAALALGRSRDRPRLDDGHEELK